MTTYKTSITGTTPFADYTFRVRGVNQQGTGAWSSESAPEQFNYNKALVEGVVNGEQTIVDDWNGTGETYEVWRILPGGSPTLTPIIAAHPFDFLIVAGGGGGGSSSTHGSHYGGLGGGGEAKSGDITLSTGTVYPIVVGSGGGQAGTGGPSSFAGMSCAPGTGGSNCHDSGCNNGTSGGPGTTSNIVGNGVDQTYPYKTTCCPGDACNYATWSQGQYGYGGGGHHASVSNCAPPGLPGVVYIAWSLGPTSTARIAEARRNRPESLEPLSCADCVPFQMGAPELDAAIDEAFDE